MSGGCGVSVGGVLLGEFGEGVDSVRGGECDGVWDGDGGVGLCDEVVVVEAREGFVHALWGNADEGGEGVGVDFGGFWVSLGDVDERAE